MIILKIREDLFGKTKISMFDFRFYFIFLVVIIKYYFLIFYKK